MGGLDNFLTQSLESIIRKNLGKQTIHKIEKRLFEKHGISLTESIEQFQKLDLVLREHFGKGADGIEEKFFKNMFDVSYNKKDEQNVKNNPKSWIRITDPNLTEIILAAFGDADKKKIMASVTEESKTVYDILKESKIPQTSGYRKINSLIEKGILVIMGHIDTHDGKKVNKYKTSFQNVRINIIKNEITVDVKLDNQNVKDSSILSTMIE